MARSGSVLSAILVLAFSASGSLRAYAQDIYKWTDANGKVHYGDRAAAPDSGQKMHISVTPPGGAVVPSPSVSRRRQASKEKSVPVPAERVAPVCKALIDQIAAVPAGRNWEALYRQFDSACPGIAYECTEYESSPQNDRCTWVERSGSRVLSRNKYP
jgi:hypothetical protein